MRTRQTVRSVAVVVLTAACHLETQAATITKANNADNLNLTSSWTGGVVPSTNDIAQWTSTVTGANSVLLGAALSLSGIKIASPGGAVTLGAGNTLTLGASGVDMSSATADLTVSSGLTLLANTRQVWNIASGRLLTLNTGTFTRGAGAVLNVQGAGSVAAATLANDATGIIGPWASFGTGTATKYATVSGGNIAGYTGISAASAADVTDTTGTTNYEVATVGAFGAGASFNTLRYTGAAGTITNAFQANGLLNVGSGALTLSGPLTIGASKELVVTVPPSGQLTLSGAVSNNAAGASGLTKAGSGQLTLQGPCAFTGTITVCEGSLQILNTTLNGGAFTNNIVVNSGGDLQYNGPANQTLSGPVAGGGSVTKWNGGQLSLDGNCTFAGPLYIGGGIVKIGATLGGGNYAGAITILSGNNLQFNSGSPQILSGTISGAGYIDKWNGGQLTLSGSNTYASTTYINSGIIKIGNASALGTTAGSTQIKRYNDGTRGELELNGFSVSEPLSFEDTGNTGSTLGYGGYLENNNTLTNAAVSGTVTLNKHGTFRGSGAITVNSVISGSSGLFKEGSGTVTLTNANTYGGATTLNGGTLSINADACLGPAPASATNGFLTFNGGTLATTASFALSDKRGIALTGAGTIDTATGIALDYSGSIAGAGSLYKAGAGTLTLYTTDAYGDTWIRNGTLKLSGINNMLPVTKTLDLDSSTGTARLELTGNSNSVSYVTASSAGAKIITDNSPTAGTLASTNQIALVSGTTVVDRVTVAQAAALNYSGLSVQNAVLILTNGAAWTGCGGIVGANGGNLGQVIINHATMTQNINGFYMCGFSSTATSSVSVVNGGLLRVYALFMPWGIGVGNPANSLMYGGPSRVDVSNATFALGAIYHQYNSNSVSSVCELTFDNATVTAHLTAAPSIDSNLTVRVRGGGVAFDLGAGTNLTVRSALTEDAGSTGGGLKKLGGGTLTLATVNAANTYSGGTTVSNGTLKLVFANLLPASDRLTVASGAVADGNGMSQTVAALAGGGWVSNGAWTVTSEVIPGGTNMIDTLTVVGTPALSGMFRVDVATDGSCDRLAVVGNLDVSGLTLQVADTTGLNRAKTYTIATYTGTLTGLFISDNLPLPWLVRYDTAAKRVYLSYKAGTVLNLL